MGFDTIPERERSQQEEELQRKYAELHFNVMRAATLEIRDSNLKSIEHQKADFTPFKTLPEPEVTKEQQKACEDYFKLAAEIAQKPQKEHVVIALQTFLGPALYDLRQRYNASIDLKRIEYAQLSHKLYLYEMAEDLVHTSEIRLHLDALLPHYYNVTVSKVCNLGSKKGDKDFTLNPVSPADIDKMVDNLQLFNKLAEQGRDIENLMLYVHLKEHLETIHNKKVSNKQIKSIVKNLLLSEPEKIREFAHALEKVRMKNAIQDYIIANNFYKILDIDTLTLKEYRQALNVKTVEDVKELFKQQPGLQTRMVNICRPGFVNDPENQYINDLKKLRSIFNQILKETYKVVKDPKSGEEGYQVDMYWVPSHAQYIAMERYTKLKEELGKEIILAQEEAENRLIKQSVESFRGQILSASAPGQTIKAIEAKPAQKDELDLIELDDSAGKAKPEKEEVEEDVDAENVKASKESDSEPEFEFDEKDEEDKKTSFFFSKEEQKTEDQIGESEGHIDEQNLQEVFRFHLRDDQEAIKTKILQCLDGTNISAMHYRLQHERKILEKKQQDMQYEIQQLQKDYKEKQESLKNEYLQSVTEWMERQLRRPDSDFAAQLMQLPGKTAEEKAKGILANQMGNFSLTLLGVNLGAITSQLPTKGRAFERGTLPILRIFIERGLKLKKDRHEKITGFSDKELPLVSLAYLYELELQYKAMPTPAFEALKKQLIEYMKNKRDSTNDIAVDRIRNSCPRLLHGIEEFLSPTSSYYYDYGTFKNTIKLTRREAPDGWLPSGLFNMVYEIFHIESERLPLQYVTTFSKRLSSRFSFFGSIASIGGGERARLINSGNLNAVPMEEYSSIEAGMGKK